MKIRTVILSLASILSIVCFVTYFFPRNGIYICGYHLFPNGICFGVSKESPKYANIDSLIVDDESAGLDECDSVSLKVKEDDMVGLEFPYGDNSVLYPFFSAMEQSAKKPVRILHYGDSQIEGDRISSYIRSKMQGMYGGRGQGEVPLYSLSSVSGVKYEYSPDWKHYSIIRPIKNFVNYGLMMSCSVLSCSTSLDQEESEDVQIEKNKVAWIRLDFNRALDEPFRLFFSSTKGEAVVRLVSSENVLSEKKVTVGGLSSISLGAGSRVKSLKIEAEGNVELYSVDIAGNSGVYVDNIPLRGSSGNGMDRSNSGLIAQMARELNVRLVVMQFGVNAIPMEENKVLSNYDFFRKTYSRQLAYLKRTIPNAVIIVIGSSDRSIRKGNLYVTNPNIPKLIKAQRQAAIENGCVFWDLFQAMGGENSMPSWVLRDKPLANGDFIHFNIRGAKYVAEMFYRALMAEYKSFKQNKG